MINFNELEYKIWNKLEWKSKKAIQRKYLAYGRKKKRHIIRIDLARRLQCELNLTYDEIYSALESIRQKFEENF